MSIKPLKNRWVVVSQTGIVSRDSISLRRKDALATFKFLADISTLDFLKYGFRCIKVNITFEEL